MEVADRFTRFCDDAKPPILEPRMERLSKINRTSRGSPESRVAGRPGRSHSPGRQGGGGGGNFEGPHDNDVALKDVVDLVLRVKAEAYSIEGANPRHAHEWQVWENVKFPAGKILIPGVIDTVTTFVEHPELVAQRIVQYANIVGRENVIAAPDCGFGTFGGWAPRVHPEIMWAKFGSLVEGARIASAKLWGRASVA